MVASPCNLCRAGLAPNSSSGIHFAESAGITSSTAKDSIFYSLILYQHVSRVFRSRYAFPEWLNINYTVYHSHAASRVTDCYQGDLSRYGLVSLLLPACKRSYLGPIWRATTLLVETMSDMILMWHKLLSLSSSLAYWRRSCCGISPITLWSTGIS